MAWMGGGTWFWVCKVKGLCNESTSIFSSFSPKESKPDSEKRETITEAPKPELKAVSLPQVNSPLSPFSVVYEGVPVMAFANNLVFRKSSEKAAISDPMKLALDSVAKVLADFPEKEIEVTGKFSNEERNRTESSNLGLARAAFISQQLIQRGVAANRIVNAYESGEIADLFFSRDSMKSGVSLRLLDPISTDSTNTLPALLSESRDLYFKYNSSEVLIDKELRNYISRAIQYLKQHPNRKCLITGHTDSYGNPDANMFLGQQRADQIKQYFIEFGLAATQIQTTSEGQNKPKADNSTSDGRRINRRVEIRIQ